MIYKPWPKLIKQKNDVNSTFQILWWDWQIFFGYFNQRKLQAAFEAEKKAKEATSKTDM